jgi:arylsulfatase A
MKRVNLAVSVLAIAAVFSSGKLQAQVASPQGSTPQGAPPPNVIIIFIDDMGYGDIASFAKTPYETPNLDRMAREGRRFTDFLVSSAVCSASRAALMTGCYHQRVGISGALGPQSKIGIHENEITLGEICKSRGYATACFGKWHLGHHEKFLPNRHGFDRYVGLPYSNDMWPLHPENVAKLKRNPAAKSDWPPLPLIEAHGDQAPNALIADVQPKDQETLTKLYTEQATQFIRDHAERPFFIYLPHAMVHVPLYVSDEFRGKSGKGIFADAVMEIDWSVGQILDTLDELKLSDNTLVIFTSDNGPWLSYGDHAGNAAHLREGKGTMFEGGVRVPTLMRWTEKGGENARISPGTTCNKLASTIDLLPTIASLVGAELPSHPIDGQDISPLLFGDEATESPRKHFVGYYEYNSLHTVRSERWKLHLPHPYRTLSGRNGGTGGQPVPYDTATSELALYDLENDPSESVDVAAEHPDIVAELQRVAADAKTELGGTQPGQKGKGVREVGKL